MKVKKRQYYKVEVSLVREVRAVQHTKPMFKYKNLKQQNTNELEDIIQKQTK